LHDLIREEESKVLYMFESVFDSSSEIMIITVEIIVRSIKSFAYLLQVNKRIYSLQGKNKKYESYRVLISNIFKVIGNRWLYFAYSVGGFT